MKRAGAAMALLGAAAARAATAASGIPFKAEAADTPSSGQWIVALAVSALVLAGLVVAARKWVAARGGAAAPAERRAGEIETLASVRLSPQQRLVSVAWRSKHLLIAVSPHGVSLVSSDDTGATDA